MEILTANSPKVEIDLSQLTVGTKVKTFGGDILIFRAKGVAIHDKYPYRFQHLQTKNCWDCNQEGKCVNQLHRDSIAEILENSRPSLVVDKIYKFKHPISGIPFEIHRDESTIYITTLDFELTLDPTEAKALSDILKEFSQEIADKKA